MKIVVTGCAGFIGSHLCEKLLIENNEVFGIDIMNDYYDVQQKYNNLNILNKYSNFHFEKDDLITTNIVSRVKPDVVVNLGAMAGVRYSIENPEIYVTTNIQGQVHLLQECVNNNVKSFVYASSSSVYGTNTNYPFNETDITESQSSPYATSKKAGELYAKLYSELYDISTIGLRFFTVYGERGRPDMVAYKLIDATLNDKNFEKFGDGTSMRDYTYVGDIVNGIIGAIKNKNKVKCQVYNLGNSHPVSLNELIETCEKVTGKKVKIMNKDVQLGDVPITYANCEKAKRDLDYNPKTSLFDGLTELYNWMKNYKNK